MFLNPQQQKFEFKNIVIDSQFDSGNLANCEKQSETQFNLYIAQDCLNTEFEKNYKSWFYFRVSVQQLQSYTFVIKNIQGQYKQFEQGLLPYYKSNQGFKKLNKEQVQFQKNQNFTELQIIFNFETKDDHYFSFCHPYSYQDLQQQIQIWEEQQSSKIQFQRFLIAKSIENRNIDMFLIKKPSSIKEDFLELQIEKPIIFLSARVHPGEVPSSHLLNGVINYIFDNCDILNHFEFLIVPMINPDGVYRGHWRVDSIGQNLNRFYLNPSKQLQPSIYMIDQIVCKYQKQIIFYIDMHAHSAKNGCFMYGNSLDFKNQIESYIFAKLITANCPDFDFENCNFTEKNMYQADKSDGLSKEGSGRVSFYKKYNILHSYTIECNFTKGSNRYFIQDLFNVSEQQFNAKDFCEWYQQIKELFKKDQIQIYDIQHYHQLGQGLLQAIQDLTKTRKQSRLQLFKSIDYLRFYQGIKLISQAPYRFDQELRGLIKGLCEKKELNIGSVKQLKQILEGKAKKK